MIILLKHRHQTVTGGFNVDKNEIIVNCHLCGKPLKIIIDMNAIVKNLPEFQKTNHKYICHDCPDTKAYWNWFFTKESLGHVVLSAKSNTDSF